jgi:hypothetical protein
MLGDRPNKQLRANADQIWCSSWATCNQTRTDFARAVTGLQVSVLDLKIEVLFLCWGRKAAQWLGLDLKGLGSDGVRTSCNHTQLVGVVEVLG